MIKSAIFYYSNSGNTKSIVEESLKNCENTYDVFNLRKIDDLSIIDDYKIIILGTPTLGNGVPPTYFSQNQIELKKYLKDKKIGLFGSGNTIYPYFCGALDLLWEWLKEENEMLFNFKFESYPTQKAINDFTSLLNKNFY